MGGTKSGLLSGAQHEVGLLAGDPEAGGGNLGAVYGQPGGRRLTHQANLSGLTGQSFGSLA